MSAWFTVVLLLELVWRARYIYRDFKVVIKKKGKRNSANRLFQGRKRKRGRACKGGVPNQSFQRTQNGRVSIHQSYCFQHAVLANWNYIYITAMVCLFSKAFFFFLLLKQNPLLSLQRSHGLLGAAGEPRTATPTFTQFLSSALRIQVQCCFTCTETIRTIRDGEPSTSTSTFTQLLSCEFEFSVASRPQGPYGLSGRPPRPSHSS